MMSPLGNKTASINGETAVNPTCASDRYVKEPNRLYGVLDRSLAGRDFIAGDPYPIAGMASYPWVVPWRRQQQDLKGFPNLERWLLSVDARPATERACSREGPDSNRPTVTEENRKVLFGETAARPKEA
jgi:GST-like protein